jgi:hypothetical protein
MSDKREQILARLLVVVSGIEGIVTAYRNKDEIDETERPSVVILDADEEAAENDPNKRPATTPRRVVMTPHIYILLNDSPENIGTHVNLFRARLIKAVLEDAELIALTHDGEGVRYEASTTALARGRSMEAECGVTFSFRYILKPSELLT